MPKKKLLLFSSSLVLLVSFFMLPQNRKWLNKIFSYYQDFPAQQSHLDKETRFERRFSNSYTLSKEITRQLIAKGGNKESVVLIPPADYFKLMGIDYRVPEPSVFYYFTDFKTIWPYSNDAINAHWYVHIQQKNIVVDTVPDRKALQDSINYWKKFKVVL